MKSVLDCNNPWVNYKTLYPLCRNAGDCLAHDVVRPVDIGVDCASVGGSEQAALDAPSLVLLVFLNALHVKEGTLGGVTLLVQPYLYPLSFAFVGEHRHKSTVGDGNEVLVIGSANVSLLFPAVVLADNKTTDIILLQYADNLAARFVEVVVHFVVALLAQLPDASGRLPVLRQLAAVMCLALVKELVHRLQRSAVDDNGLEAVLVGNHRGEVVNAEVDSRVGAVALQLGSVLHVVDHLEDVAVRLRHHSDTGYVGEALNPGRNLKLAATEFDLAGLLENFLRHRLNGEPCDVSALLLVQEAGCPYLLALLGDFQMLEERSHCSLHHAERLLCDFGRKLTVALLLLHHGVDVVQDVVRLVLLVLLIYQVERAVVDVLGREAYPLTFGEHRVVPLDNMSFCQLHGLGGLIRFPILLPAPINSTLVRKNYGQRRFFHVFCNFQLGCVELHGNTELVMILSLSTLTE